LPTQNGFIDFLNDLLRTAIISLTKKIILSGFETTRSDSMYF